ncbi:hypothetical protein AC579_5413 [Pseudocercospora musae]|uniref:Uncharacterized protein n=1 Tax=Pseudocercospora musae TaxID=113226 RepID=A0A139I1K2_9PEZI|nr:hypothetical protein AC579_5413 [Pseudocercospora musae]
MYSQYRYTSSREASRGGLDLQNDDIWTEARCNRLLRSITSRVEALRKVIQPDIKKLRERHRPCHVSRPKTEHWSAIDPAWLPSGKAKSQQQTYAGKMRSTKRLKACIGDERRLSRTLTLPSPFVKRLMQASVDGAGRTTDTHVGRTTNTAAPAHTLVDDGSERLVCPKRRRRSRQLPLRPCSAREGAEVALITAFEHVLHSTRQGSTKRRLGTRSLRSTCLRQVPACIAIDEQCRDDEDDDEKPSDVLAVLESTMSSSQGGGWPGLRVVVRAQCISQICQAMTDCLLSDSIIDRLVELCCKNDAMPEAEEISQTCLSRLPHWNPARIWKLCDSPLPAAMTERLLSRYAQKSPAILAEMIRVPEVLRLVLASTLTADDVTSGRTSLLPQWTAIDLRAINQQEITAAQSKALSKGTSEIYSKLCAMTLASSMVSESSNGQVLHSLAHEAALEAGKSYCHLLHHPVAHACLILEALSFATLPGLTPFMDSLRAVKDRKLDRHLRDTSSIFTAALAADLAALGDQTRQPLIGLLIDRICESLKNEAVPALLFQSLQDLASRAVQVLSPRLEQYEACDYMEKVAKIMEHSRTEVAGSCKTPHLKGKQWKVRWEDDIAEWISRTPFTPAVATSDLSDDKENGEPSEDAQYKSEGLVLRSPDILAFTPNPAASKSTQKVSGRRKGERPGLVRSDGYAHPQVILPTYRVAKKRRVSTRIASKHTAEDSEDELCLS